MSIEMRHAARVSRGEARRDGASQVDARHGGVGHPQGGQRALDVFGLRGDSEIGVERPVGLPVAEQIHRDRRVAALSQGRRDGSPEEPARSESV